MDRTRNKRTNTRSVHQYCIFKIEILLHVVLLKSRDFCQNLSWSLGERSTIEDVGNLFITRTYGNVSLSMKYKHRSKDEGLAYFSALFLRLLFFTLIFGNFMHSTWHYIGI